MERDMTKGSPLPVILRFTLPLIIGNIFQQLYNMQTRLSLADMSERMHWLQLVLRERLCSWCLDLRRASQQALRF